MTQNPSFSFLPKVGISDIAIYLPKLKIQLNTIIENRAKGKESRLEKVLKRTLEKTGLSSMYFPETWEDSVTMAASATYQLIQRQGFPLKALRYLVSGTETGVDHSKPLSAYVIGVLKKAGLKIPQTLSSFQTQHACAGGTVALLAISALLGFSTRGEESGIVLCSDIARYGRETSAEMTQGAGAVALLTEQNPKLLELNLASVGYSSLDVDDFFRPLGSSIAKVKGSFSVRCYMEAMETALNDHATREEKTPGQVLRETDMFALHVPYPKLPLDTMKTLLNKYLDMDKTEAETFLEEKGFFAMTYPASRSGNIYTGSMYLSLAFLLKERYEKLGESIVGKKVLLGSYGSGNTVALFSATVAPEATKVIEGWDLDNIWQKEEASFADYELWATHEAAHDIKQPTPKAFYLENIREDGYREYQFQH